MIASSSGERGTQTAGCAAKDGRKKKGRGDLEAGEGIHGDGERQKGGSLRGEEIVVKAEEKRD